MGNKLCLIKEGIAVENNSNQTTKPVLNHTDGQSFANTQNVSPVIGNIPVPNTPTTAPPQQSATIPAAPVTEKQSTPQYATVSKRASASFIDGLIVGGISLILNAPAYVTQFKSFANSMSSGYTAPPSIDQVSFGSSNPLYTILSLIGVVFGIAYPIYFIGKTGATPGKKIMKIKVIDKETQLAPGYLKAFLREFVGRFIASIFLYLGYFWILWDKEKQGWHDKIAGTVVVDNK